MVTLTSACDETTVDTVDWLLLEFGSVVVVETFAVFPMNVIPPPEGRWMTMVKTAVADGASEAMLHVVMPVTPFVLQVNAGPLFCVAETNVVFGGFPSVMTTFAAVDGPLFVTVTV